MCSSDSELVLVTDLASPDMVALPPGARWGLPC